MKQVNLVHPVMEKVVRFEKKRVWWWIGRLLAIFAVLCVLLIGSLYLLARSLLEEEVVMLLSLYTQDVSMLRRFWAEALSFVWEVEPHEVAYVAGGAVVIFLAIIYATRHKRRVILRRLKTLDNFSKKYYKRERR